MTLEARKIKFVREFLNLQNEEVISMLENILADKISEKQEFKAMTKEELHKRIDQSENDFKNGQFKSSDELLAKYQ